MSRHRNRMDRDTAERLLSGTAVDPPHSNDRLARLIAAACAPPHPSETLGDRAAMDAFRAARLDLAHQPRRPSMIETALAKLLSLKLAAAAVVVAAAATGGVALAASTGVLPNPIGGGTAGVERSVQPSGPPSTAAGQKHGAASPSLIGLCRAYAAGAGDNHGKALENPAFGALITAAGGRDKVDGYCDTVLAADTLGEPTATPTDGQRSDRSVAPDGRPSGNPDILPSTAPTTPGAPPSTAAPTTRTSVTPGNDHKPTAPAPAN